LSYSTGTAISGVTTATSAAALLSNVYSKSKDFVGKSLHPFAKLPMGKRVGLLLKKTAVAGILAFRKQNKLTTLYRVRKAVHTVSDDETKDVWLGTTSNNAASVRPKFIPDTALCNVISVVSKKDIPTEVDIPTGQIDIDKDDDLLKKFFYDGGDLIDDYEKVAVRLPAIAPAPFGFSFKVGSLDQGAYDGLEQVDDAYYPFWADAINNHNAELQQLLLTENSLKKYLPARTAVGHGYIDSPFITFGDIDEDDEPLNDAAEELRLECERIAKDALTKSIEEQLSAKARSEGSSVASKPVGEIDTEPGKAPATEPVITQQQYYNARLLALGMNFDPKSRKLTYPTLSKFIPMIRDASSRQAQRDAVLSTFESIEDMLTKSTHFLYRNLEFPQLEKVSASYLGQCTWSPDPIDSLDITQASGFVLNMALPDTLATSKAKAEAAGIDVAEDALGEHYSKKTKLDTGFATITELAGLHTLLTTMANDVCVFHLYFDFKLDSTTPMPNMPYYIEQYALHLTEKRARAWIKKNRAEALQLFYYVLSQICNIQARFAQASKDVMVLNAILRGKLEDVPTSHYAMADSLFTESLTVINRVVLGSSEAPSSVLWRNSPHKKRADEKESKRLMSLMSPRDTPSRKDRERERRKSTSNDTKRFKTTGDAEEGWLECDKPNLNLPKKVYNKDKRMCKSHLRTDTVCQFGDRCNACHDHFTDLSRAEQKSIVKMVDKDDKLKFVGIAEELLKELREEIAKEDES
jgi:hypothetical protein